MRSLLVMCIFSVLGGILLVGGLYSVLWGKGREQKMNERSSLTAEVDHTKECSELKEAAAAAAAISKSPPPLLIV